MSKEPPAPAYLFLGQEGYNRQICRQALIDKVLPAESRIEGFSSVDLGDTTLASVLDDARSMSLFATERLLWVKAIETALPRRLSASSDEDDDREKPPESGLKDYLRSPTPGTVVVFECSRYDFTGDDRPKLERVQKFFSALPAAATVEFRHFTPESSRYLAQNLAKQNGVKLSGAELASLLEAVAGDASRLAAEIEKLSLFVGQDRAVTMNDLRALVPNAAQTTIFELVNALGKRDRAAALRSLDLLVRDGEYLPLALTFLSTQFRLALAAKEAKINSAQQAQSFFAKLGIRLWRERSEQILSTAAAFTAAQLRRALRTIYDTDKKFREGYRDDRLVMETLVLSLTAK